MSLRSVLFLLVTLAVDRLFLYISPHVKTMLGFSPEDWREDPMLWERQIHPEDRERVLAETRWGLQQHSKVWFNIEYRMITKDGRVVWVLNQTVPEYGVSGRLRNLRGLVLDVTGRHTPLERDISSLLFEAANELLVNVVKHAGVEECGIRVQREGDWIRVTVEDDGSGFDPAEIGPRKSMEGGFGLFSIKDRMSVIGGRLEIESEPGRG